MKEYMLIYKGGDPAWMKNTSQEDMAASLERWGEWMGGLAQKDQLVTGGSPLQYAGKTVTKAGIITDIAASELKELVSGYSIIKAENIDEASEIAKHCPIFNTPVSAVEVREIVQLPND